MKRPLAVFGFSLLAVLSTGFAGSVKSAMYMSAAVFIAAAVFGVFLKSSGRFVLFIVCCASFLAVSTFSYNYFYVYRKAAAFIDTKTCLSGTYDGSSENNSYGYIFTLKNCTIGGIATDYAVSIFSRTDIDAQPGDTVSLEKVTLSKTKRYSSSEYTDISYGIYLTASVYDDSFTVSKNENPGIIAKIILLRARILNNLREYYSKDESGVLAALILGETAAASTEIKNAFRISGLSHLFAVSGLHLSLWSGLVYKFIGIYHKKQRLQSVGAIVFVLFFMALTLFTPSVCRSGIMLIMIYAGNLVRKDSDSLNSLGLAVAIMLCLNPFYAANASFLLSVFATFAVVVLYPPTDAYIRKHLSSINSNLLKKLLSFIFGSLALCMTVSVFLIPLSAYFFGYTSFVAPLANLLCVYPAELAMISGCIGCFVSLIFPSAALFIADINRISVNYLINVTQGLSTLPFAMFSLNKPFVLPWFFCSSAAVAFYLFFSKHKRRILEFIILSLCVFILTSDVYYYVHRNDVSLSVHNSDLSSFAVLENGFESKIYISFTGTEDSYSDICTHFKNEQYPKCEMLMLLSRENSSQSRASALIGKLSAKTAVCPAGSYISVYNENTQLVISDEACFEIWNGIKITYIRTEKFCGAAISAENNNIILCRGDGDIPQEYKSCSVIRCDTADTPKEITLR